LSSAISPQLTPTCLRIYTKDAPCPCPLSVRPHLRRLLQPGLLPLPLVCLHQQGLQGHAALAPLGRLHHHTMYIHIFIQTHMSRRGESVRPSIPSRGTRKNHFRPPGKGGRRRRRRKEAKRKEGTTQSIPSNPPPPPQNKTRNKSTHRHLQQPVLELGRAQARVIEAHAAEVPVCV
jgi:hypothetical protein